MKDTLRSQGPFLSRAGKAWAPAKKFVSIRPESSVGESGRMRWSPVIVCLVTAFNTLLAFEVSWTIFGALAL
jgi:hypothetical protein